MITKHKELYEAPTTDVVEVKQEGVICSSTDATMNGTWDESDA